MRYVTLLAVAGLILAVSVPAGATSVYVSTFTTTQADFSLYGFSSGGVPTAGPTYLDITNVGGTYDLDIPPAGGSWDVYVDGSMEWDFNKDGTTDATATYDEYVGNYVSPGPTTSWGPSGPIPFTMTYEDPILGTLVLDLTVEYDVDLDGAYPSGSFGGGAYMQLTYAGPDIFDFNALLTGCDNLYGGGDGVIDGWVSCNTTVTAVPEPLTMLAVFMGITGLAGYVRKRNVPRGRKLA